MPIGFIMCKATFTLWIHWFTKKKTKMDSNTQHKWISISYMSSCNVQQLLALTMLSLPLTCHKQTPVIVKILHGNSIINIHAILCLYLWRLWNLIYGNINVYEQKGKQPSPHATILDTKYLNGTSSLTIDTRSVSSGPRLRSQ